jgi:hypothetical protein
MRKIILFFSILCFALIGANKRRENPDARISNGTISAHLYLPDTENGYYRGTRFDWAGQISELTYQQHNYFGKWFQRYSPFLHDAIMGPVEAFDPIGFEEAPTGGHFLKIGAGVLEKPAMENYDFAAEYKLLNAGKWQIEKKSDHVRFTQTLNDNDFKYVYTKTVRLVRNQPELVLEHVLKNNGAKTLETNVMDHNFFVIDAQVTGSDFTVTFPYPISSDTTNRTSASISGNNIVLEAGDPADKKFFLENIRGFGPDAADYHFTVKNSKTKAAVTVTADRPIEKMNFWASVRTVCPEPFIHVKVDPGKEFRWSIHYRFHED